MEKKLGPIQQAGVNEECATQYYAMFPLQSVAFWSAYVQHAK